jgi:signal transduction histidine kinase
MIVQDNGIGFIYNQTHPINAEGHLGLIHMQERVGLFGGMWSLETSPGQGTRISATWRIPQAELAN